MSKQSLVTPGAKLRSSVLFFIFAFTYINWASNDTIIDSLPMAIIIGLIFSIGLARGEKPKDPRQNDGGRIRKYAWIIYALAYVFFCWYWIFISKHGLLWHVAALILLGVSYFIRQGGALDPDRKR